MSDADITTNQTCECGEKLSLCASSEPLRGIHGRYESDGRIMHAAVNCSNCG